MNGLGLSEIVEPDECFALTSCDCEEKRNLGHYMYFLSDNVDGLSMASVMQKYKQAYNGATPFGPDYCAHIVATLRSLLAWDSTLPFDFYNAVDQMAQVWRLSANDPGAQPHEVFDLDEFPAEPQEILWPMEDNTSSSRGPLLYASFSSMLWAIQRPISTGEYKCCCKATRTIGTWSDGGIGSHCNHPKVQFESVDRMTSRYVRLIMIMNICVFIV